MTPQAALPYLAGLVIACWLVATLGYLPQVAKRVRFPLGITFFVLGWLLIVGYMGWMWMALQRPPMRTQGETRLWYALMLPAIGLVIQWRWKKNTLAAMPILIMLMASVFIIITALNPDSFDKSLMPALQSPWFVPHVLVYMASYAIFGLTAVISLWTLGREIFIRDGGCDRAAVDMQRLVNIGFPLLTTGLIFGALWAKVAWGHYWSWDPKETWAFLSWAVYLIYLHLKTYTRLSSRMHLVVLIGAVLVIFGCWFGVNSLPTSQQSMHSYMN